MQGSKLIIGTRGSDLARWQADFVARRLEEIHRGVEIEIRIIRTIGDKILDVPLADIGDKGLFTKELETALLKREIDLAVHSLKDMQTIQPDGLSIGAVLKREDPSDVLISKGPLSIDELPDGATVATGSLRRRSQLLHYRPDLNVADIRGNVPTRLQKFAESDYTAMILAYAGLHRLGLDSHISQLIPSEIMLPAVGQGALAVQVRSGDDATQEIIGGLEDKETRQCVTAERAFLRGLEGGCQVPVGALARLEEGAIVLEGMAGDLNGAVNLRQSISGPADSAKDLGAQLAGRLIDAGAGDLIALTRDLSGGTK